MNNLAIDITQEPTDRFALALKGLEPESAVTLKSAFLAMFAQADEWIARARLIKVTDVSQTREMKFARESRLALKEIRVAAEKTRKRLKEDSTRRGKAIDGLANIVKDLIEPIEAELLEKEQFAERADAVRRSALRDARAETVKALGADPGAYADLEQVDDATWVSILEGAQAAHDTKIQAAKEAEEIRVHAEKLAAEKREADRVARVKLEAERVERERLQTEENARLRAEAQEREAAAKVERERVEAERAEDRAKAKAEKEERNRVADLAMAAARAEQEQAEKLHREETRAREEEAAKARAEKNRAEVELAAVKAEAERARVAELARIAGEAAEREAAALAPDREKLAAFAGLLRGLEIPTCATPKGQAAAKKIGEQLEKTIAWISRTGESL